MLVGKGEGSSAVAAAKPRSPRFHYYIGRVAKEVTEENIIEYCKGKNLQPVACRKISSAEASGTKLIKYHFIFFSKKTLSHTKQEGYETEQ